MTAKPSPHSQHQFISPFHSDKRELSALAEIAQKMVRNAVDLLMLDDCALALVDEAGTNLVIRAISQADSTTEQVADTIFPLHEGPLANIASQREALILSNARFDARMQTLAGETSRTVIGLPLLVQDQLLGVLIASSSTQFTPEKLPLLTLLAEQITLALTNARQAALVRDADRMKANFLSLVTHELRSPLNTINGYLDLVLEGIAGELNEQQQEFIQRARAGSEHLYALLEDLLLASRSDSGQLRLSCAPASLEEMVTNAVEELEMVARDGKVTVEIQLPDALPALFVDGVRFQQVVRNLLSNALRFTPAGGRVMISARVLPAQGDGEQEHIEVRVRDTGIGIAPEYHERIFERFFQVPPPGGGRTSGQGLGLAIVKMIVELHGGRVHVESTPGEGSTFAFTLNVFAQE